MSLLFSSCLWFRLFGRLKVFVYSSEFLAQHFPINCFPSTLATDIAMRNQVVHVRIKASFIILKFDIEHTQERKREKTIEREIFICCRREIIVVLIRPSRTNLIWDQDRCRPYGNRTAISGTVSTSWMENATLVERILGLFRCAADPLELLRSLTEK